MNNLVIMYDQQAVTTSLVLAEAFNKNHRDVLEKISSKINSAENSTQYKKMFACMAFACSVDLYRWNKKRKGGDGK